MVQDSSFLLLLDWGISFPIVLDTTLEDKVKKLLRLKIKMNNHCSISSTKYKTLSIWVMYTTIDKPIVSRSIKYLNRSLIVKIMFSTTTVP